MNKTEQLAALEVLQMYFDYIPELVGDAFIETENLDENGAGPKEQQYLLVRNDLLDVLQSLKKELAAQAGPEFFKTYTLVKHEGHITAKTVEQLNTSFAKEVLKNKGKRPPGSRYGVTSLNEKGYPVTLSAEVRELEIAFARPQNPAPSGPQGELK